MTAIEMKDMFDLLYNNSASEAVAPLSDFEISLYLTKAQEELVKNKISLLGNKYHEGVENSEKRLVDLQPLVTIKSIPLKKVDDYVLSGNTYKPHVNDYSYINRATWLTDVMFVLTEKIYLRLILMASTVGPTTVIRGKDEEEVLAAKNIHSKVYGDKYRDLHKIVTFLNYNEYQRKVSKPYKFPLKDQVWKISSDALSGIQDTYEYIFNYNDMVTLEKLIDSYKSFLYDNDRYFVFLDYGKQGEFLYVEDSELQSNVKYIRRPKPIITGNLPNDVNNNPLTVEGISTMTNCELNAGIHNEIVQRAVELAKGTYSYDENGNVQMTNQVQLGERSE